MAHAPRSVAALALGLVLAAPPMARAQEPAEVAAAPERVRAEVPVETLELANGMELLLVSRPELTTVSAGWVAHVGSAD
jgi:hypothetical protein